MTPLLSLSTTLMRSLPSVSRSTRSVNMTSPSHQVRGAVMTEPSTDRMEPSPAPRPVAEVPGTPSAE